MRNFIFINGCLQWSNYSSMFFSRAQQEPEDPNTSTRLKTKHSSQQEPKDPSALPAPPFSFPFSAFAGRLSKRYRLIHQADRRYRPTAARPRASNSKKPGSPRGYLRYAGRDTQGIPRASHETYSLGMPRVRVPGAPQLTLGQLYPRAPWGSRSSDPPGAT